MRFASPGRPAAVVVSILVLHQAVALGQFSGSVTINGMTCKVDDFLYDTENGNPGTSITMDCAVMLGLGTKVINTDKGGYEFIPKGTNVKSGSNNGGALTFYIFSGATVDAVDSKGKDCPVKNQTIIVAKDYSGANITLATQASLNQSWINAAGPSGSGACIVGAGDDAKGYWKSEWPKPPIESPSIQPQINPANGLDLPAIPIRLTGPAGSTTLPMLYDSLSNYTFLPESVAIQLGLKVTGSIDLSVADPNALFSLQLKSMDLDGQTVFSEAYLPGLDTGLGPTQGGMVLILDDVNSSFGALGGNFTQGYVYANNAFPDGGDLFGNSVPEPGGVALLGLGLTLAAALRRGRPARRPGPASGPRREETP